MKQLTINIKDDKYSFFLELIKSMDFVSIADNEDWYETLSANDKKSIQKGIEDIENGRIHSHEEVMALAKKKIADLKKTK
jgi:predicted transcriptional regulator